MQCLKLRRTEEQPTSPYVWSYLSGTHRWEPFSIRTIQDMTRTTANRAGLDPAKVSPHNVRHAFATTWAEQGRNLHEMGTILGYADPTTTAIDGRVKVRQLEAAAASQPDVPVKHYG